MTFRPTATRVWRSAAFRASNVRSTKGNAYYVPTVTPNVKLWWDAAAPLTLASSGTHPSLGTPEVTGWADRVSGQVLAPMDGDQTPGYTYDAGRRAVYFTKAGAADSLRTGTLPAGITDQPIVSIWVACGRVRDGVTFDRVFYLGSNSNNYGLTITYSTSSELMRVLVGTGATYTTVNIGTGQADGSIYGVASAVGNIVTYINGVEGGTSSLTPVFGDTPIAIAGLNPGGHAYLGPLFEVIVVAGAEALTHECRCRIEGYLAHKWNLAHLLPSDHNFRFNAP